MATSYPDARVGKEVGPRLSYTQTRLKAVLREAAHHTQRFMIFAVVLLVFGAICLPARAQTEVTGRILDGSGSPVPYASQEESERVQ